MVLPMAEQVDAIVIGGGIVGLFTSLQLARAGKTVRLIDKTHVGTARHNTGAMILQGRRPEWHQLMQFTHERWQKTAEELGSSLGFEQCGSAILNFTEDAAAQLAQVSAPNGDYERHVVTDIAEIGKVFGDGVKVPEKLSGISHAPIDASLETSQTLDHLRRAAVQAGVRIWGSDTVTELMVDNGHVKGVKTDSGDVSEAPYVILVAGVWSNKIPLPETAKLPLRPARCHLIEMIPHGNMPTPVLILPTPFGEVIIHRQRSGRAMVAYTGVMDKHQATWSTIPRPQTVEWLKNLAGVLLPALGNARIAGDPRCISLAVTPDNMPYIGPFEGLSGLLVASGLSGQSYAMAAGVADIMTAYVTGQDIPLDLGAFAPARFSAKPAADNAA